MILGVSDVLGMAARLAATFLIWYFVWVLEQLCFIRSKKTNCVINIMLTHSMSSQWKIFDFSESKEGQNYTPITAQEIYNWVKYIRDPEHTSMTLEDLQVVSLENIFVDDKHNFVQVVFVPTTASCSLGSIVGLTIKVLLLKILPLRFNVRVICKADTHETWNSLNKQINDKERVLAAMGNPNVRRIVERCIKVDNQIV